MSEELSWENQKHIEELSAVSMGIAVICFGVYLVYGLDNNLWKSTSELILWWGFPFIMLAAGSGMITYQSLYSRKVKRSFKYHLRILAGRFALILVAYGLYAGLVIGLHPVLYPLVGGKDFLISGTLASILFAVFAFLFKDIIKRRF